MTGDTILGGLLQKILRESYTRRDKTETVILMADFKGWIRILLIILNNFKKPYDDQSHTFLVSQLVTQVTISDEIKDLLINTNIKKLKSFINDFKESRAGDQKFSNKHMSLFYLLSFNGPRLFCLQDLTMYRDSIIASIVNIEYKLQNQRIDNAAYFLCKDISENKKKCGELKQAFARMCEFTKVINRKASSHIGLFGILPSVKNMLLSEEEQLVGWVAVLLSKESEILHSTRGIGLHKIYFSLLTAGFSESMAVRVLIYDNKILQKTNEKKPSLCLSGTIFQKLYEGTDFFDMAHAEEPQTGQDRQNCNKSSFGI